MLAVRIAIVGGGLAGLYAAYLLEQKGIHDYVVLEAREGWGGRIATTPSITESSALDRFDLGPTWFWPDYQAQLDRLIQSLGLERFAQYEKGSMLVERTPHGAAERMPGYTYVPPSMRLIGGMSALIDALRRPLPAHKLLLNHRVRHIRSEGQHVELDVEAAQQAITFRVESLLLAVPPRLAATTIEFLPELPGPLLQAWRATATWMAPHAKYLAIYDEPFWRAQALSGEARSACGPLGEMHDASMPGGSAALFGFFALPAALRKGIPEETLRLHCRAQFTRLFGERAATPRADFLKDWAADSWTATEADQSEVAQHGSAPPSSAAEGPWRGRLTGIASEWSPQFPGYVAGAVEAAALGVDQLLRQKS